MCQIASSVDRWIRHLRVLRIKSLSRAVGIKKNRRGKAFEVSIICSPHWNQTKYGEDQSSRPHKFWRPLYPSQSTVGIFSLLVGPIPIYYSVKLFHSMPAIVELGRADSRRYFFCKLS